MSNFQVLHVLDICRLLFEQHILIITLMSCSDGRVGASTDTFSLIDDLLVNEDHTDCITECGS